MTLCHTSAGRSAQRTGSPAGRAEPASRPGDLSLRVATSAPARLAYAQRPPRPTQPPAAPPVAAPATGQPAPPPATATPTLSLSNHTGYADTGSESHKQVRFDVTVPAGQNPRDYALVNKIRGEAVRNPRGDPFYVTMDQISVPYYFTSWRVDSPDADPVYASSGSLRWTYTPTPSGFYTTDDPGPARSSEPGSFWDLCFKTELHRLAAVPTVYSAPLPAPLDTKYWRYYVRVDGSGRFSHTRPRGEPDRCDTR